MIRDKNIDPNAEIATSKLQAAGLALLIGPVFGVNGIRYVDSLHANSGDTEAHGTKGQPFNTLSYALTQAAIRDAFIVAPGHAENVVSAAKINMDKVGVQIFGFGLGEYMPTFTFLTSTAATFKISASGCRVHGLRFTQTLDAIIRMIDIIEDSFLIDGCEFAMDDGSAAQSLEGIDLSHADADGGKILNCLFSAALSDGTGANSGIKIATAITRLEIAGCKFYGRWANACIHNPTANTAKELDIHDNRFENLVAAAHAVELVSACTGLLFNNLAMTQVSAGGDSTIFDIGGCGAVENYAADTDVNTSGILTPGTTT